MPDETLDAGERPEAAVEPGDPLAPPLPTETQFAAQSGEGGAFAPRIVRGTLPPEETAKVEPA